MSMTDDRIGTSIYDIVCEAIIAGWTPERIRNEVLECWQQAMKEEIERGIEVLKK